MANILITGASSGIGEALAYYYAKFPTNNLFLCGRNVDRLSAVAKKCGTLGAKVFSQIADVTSPAQMQAWIEACHQQAPLNLVIANAGVATCDDESTDAIYNTFQTNVFGVLNTVLPALEIFKKETYKNKQIAIMSSIAGYYGMPPCPAYSASKNCVKAFGQALRGRYGKKDIKINVICPGFIRSRITEKNTCPMPFFMEADFAAQKIAKGLRNNQGIISFPWQLRIAVWLMSVLPNPISNFIGSKLPYKV